MDSNEKGPAGWCGDKDIERITQLSSLAPSNGVIFEIGSLLGQSTYALAKNCHPSVTVFAVDVWNPNFMLEEMIRNFGDALLKPVFRKNTSACANIIPLQGEAPNDLDDWNIPIDIAFDDGFHENPGLTRDQQFLMSHLKPGGVLCGHDYHPTFPDIMEHVDRLGKEWNQTPDIHHLVWSLMKPKTATAALHPPVDITNSLTEISDHSVLLDALRRPNITPPVIFHNPRNPLPPEVQTALKLANCQGYFIVPPELLAYSVEDTVCGIYNIATPETSPLPGRVDLMIVTEELTPAMRLGLQTRFWKRLRPGRGLVYLHEATTTTKQTLIAHEMACHWLQIEAFTNSGGVLFKLERSIPRLVRQVDTEVDLSQVQKQAIFNRFNNRIPSYANLRIA